VNTLQAMSVFVHVAELGGFAPAARRLGLSTSAVSRHVAELETAVGAQLLRRTTRRLSLTEAGTRYLPRARAIVEEVDALHTEIGERHAAPSGLLRVSLPPGTGNFTLAPLAIEFLTRYPDIALELDVTERVVDLVAEGYDAAVRAGPLVDSSLASRKLIDLHFVTCASPAYCARYGMPDRPEDLSRHSCIHFPRRRGDMVWTFTDGDRRIPVRVSGRYVINDIDAERRAALAGLGIVALTWYDAHEDLEAGRLIRLLPAFDYEPFPITFVWPRAAIEPRKLRLFIDFIAEALVRRERDRAP
jgi:DNA-binding transcriptional LysR family regulator